MKRLASLLTFSLLLVLIAAPAAGIHAQETMLDPTAPVTIVAEALYPEGIAYNPLTGGFIVSSLRFGTVHNVAPDGTLTVFNDDERLISTIGVHVDAERERVLVAVSDPGASVRTSPETQGVLAALAVFELATGNLLAYVDLGALAPGIPHFANDITVAADGTIYVTDSFSPILYVVDGDYNPAILLQDERLAGEGFGFNGITTFGEAYLLVAVMNQGRIYRVPLANPEALSIVFLEENLLGADGINLDENGALIVNINETGRVVRLESADGWISAELTGSVDVGLTYPTTNAIVDGVAWALLARLDVLFNPETTEQVGEFLIQPVTFGE